MIKITFKDVGQGDSIILEWEGEKGKKIAIIDCKRYKNRNPVLDYINDNNVKEIAFLLLSHPHLDHCSGFAELINFCIDNGVKIKYFIHTSNNMPGFWRAAVEGKEAETKILELFYVIRDAYQKIGMLSHPIQAGMMHADISLNNELSISIIAPTNKHLDYYANNIVNTAFEEETGNKPQANWLGTIIKIYSNVHDGYILLTSDTNKEAMFYNVKNPKLYEGRLILAQCPHHGAEGNFKPAFWKLIRKYENTPIIISVGKNRYGHPSEKAIYELNKNNYDIYSTNEIGSLSRIKETPVSKDTVTHLRTYGEFAPTLKNDKLNGDKIFEINLDGTVKYVN